MLLIKLLAEDVIMYFPLQLKIELVNIPMSLKLGRVVKPAKEMEISILPPSSKAGIPDMCYR